MKTEAENSVIHLQAEEYQKCQEMPESRTGKEGFFPTAFEGSITLPTSWHGFILLSTYTGEIKAYVFT